MLPVLRSIQLPPAPVMARQIATARVVLAAAALAAPVQAVRLLGTDTATARRVSWLSRMMAIRDGAIGVGGLDATRRTGSVAPWLLAGAVSDALDVAVVAAALKHGRLKGVGAAAVLPIGAGAALAGALTALRLRRG